MAVLVTILIWFQLFLVCLFFPIRFLSQFAFTTAQFALVPPLSPLNQPIFCLFCFIFFNVVYLSVSVPIWHWRSLRPDCDVSQHVSASIVNYGTLVLFSGFITATNQTNRPTERPTDVDDLNWITRNPLPSGCEVNPHEYKCRLHTQTYKQTDLIRLNIIECTKLRLLNLACSLFKLVPNGRIHPEGMYNVLEQANIFAST